MKKIYINPGHSDQDPGAVGFETERRLNVAVARYMAEYLPADYVCETRMSPGTMLTLAEVCSDANSWGADLFVSVHFNAGGGDGFECYIYNWSNRELGAIFANHAAAAGQNLRYPDNAGEPLGVKVRPALFVLKNTAMPAVLCEGAFVDNQKDIAGWNDDLELQKLGTAYGKAAAEFLRLEKRRFYVRYTATLGPFEDRRAAQAVLDALLTAGYTGEVSQ